MASLYEMAQGPDFDPLEAFMQGRRARFDDRLRQNKLAEMARMDQARPLMAGALRGDRNALGRLADFDPAGYMDVNKFQNAQAQVQREISDADMQKVAGVAYGADTPEKWRQGMAYLKSQGMDIDDADMDFANRDAFLGMAGGLGGTMKRDQFDRGQKLSQFNAETSRMNAEKRNAGGQGQNRPPSGYRWSSDGNLEPIQGGPADPKLKGQKTTRLSPMPAELAARIGLAKDFGAQVPGLKEVISGGLFGEPTDFQKRADMLLQRGEAGRVYREIRAGSEAITRMLTGAGMNMAEAQNEANMYLPGQFDTTETILNKIDQLNRRLNQMVGEASAGRVSSGIKPQVDFQPQQPQQEQSYPGADGVTEQDQGGGFDAGQEQGLTEQDLPDLMSGAQQAIADGADPEAVIQRLIEMGVDPQYAGTLVNGQ